MEITTKAYLVKSINNIEEFNIIVNEDKVEIIVEKLNLEYKKLVNFLKKLKEQELITSINYPKNYKLQREIDNIVTTKKEIKKSIDKIKTIFL